MSVSVTSVTNSQSFGTWLARTNQIASIISSNVVTTANSAIGGFTNGNGTVNGIFGSTTLFVRDELRGGNVTNSNTITISSNANFRYNSSNLVSIVGNTTSTNVNIAVDTVNVNTVGNTNFAVSHYNITTSTNTNISGSGFYANVTSATLQGSTSLKANSTHNILVANSSAYTLTANATAIALNSNVNIFGSTLVANADLTVNGLTTLTGNASLSSRLVVTGNATFSNSVAIVGNVSLSNTLAVTGNVVLSNTITITGAANLSSTLDVTGATTLSNTIAVTGNATFSNTFAVTGAANLNSTLGVAGALTVSGNSTLGGANTTISSNVNVTGSFLNVASVFVVNSTGAYHTGIVNAASHRSGTNFVANASGVFVGNVSTNGTLTTNSLYLIRGDETTNAYSHEMSTTSIRNQKTITGTSPTTRDVSQVTRTELYLVSGEQVFDTSIYNSKLFANTIHLFIGNTTSNSVVNSSSITTSGTLSATGAVTLSNTIAVTGNATFSNSVAVTGNVTISNTFAVTGAATLSNTLTVTGKTQLSTANISSTFGVNGAVTIANTLQVDNNITGSANVTVSGSANVATAINIGANVSSNTTALRIGNTISNTIVSVSSYYIGNTVSNTTINSSSISTSGTLSITGEATLSNTLNVTGLSTFNNANVTGSIFVNSSIVTTGFVNAASANISGNVVIAGSLTVSGNQTIVGTTLYDSALVPSSNGISLGNTTNRWNLSAVSGNFTSGLTISGGNTDFNSGVLFVDATNSRVGISNTSPGNKFTISGGNLQITTATSGIVFSDSSYQNTAVRVFGSNTHVQFNNSGSLGASAGFTFNSSTNNAIISNTLSSSIVSSNNLILNSISHSIGSSYSFSSTAEAIVDSFSATTYRSAEYTIQISDATNSKYHLTKILVTHNGTDPHTTEFGSIYNNGSICTFRATISGGNINILGTPATATTVVKIHKVLITV